ncbi:MAG: RNA 3'-terminal phosphate cyclase [Methanocellales archaeon]
MIEIDGSFGEGGGSIVRMATAFSAITGQPFRIYNIRANRPNPGLAAQHLKAVETVAKLCNASTKGLKIHSKEFEFHPREIVGGEFKVDIGTAGSITLLLQCIMPIAVRAKAPIVLIISGGTDVAWSPPVDYLRFVTLPILREMGYNGEIQLIKRGYYPRGGGVVRANILPSRLRKLEIKVEREKVIKGISHSMNLPVHIPERQAKAAAQILKEAGFEADVEIEIARDQSTGSGITLWSYGIGGSSLGERGKPAEKVGEEAARAILAELKSGALVDIYLADQLIPYIALSGGSYTAREITMHTKTNIWIGEKFLGVKIEVEEEKGLFKITCVK